MAPLRLTAPKLAPPLPARRLSAASLRLASSCSSAEMLGPTVAAALGSGGFHRAAAGRQLVPPPLPPSSELPLLLLLFASLRARFAARFASFFASFLARFASLRSLFAFLAALASRANTSSIKLAPQSSAYCTALHVQVPPHLRSCFSYARTARSP